MSEHSLLNSFLANLIFHKATHNKVRTILYIEGSQVIISENNIKLLSLKIDIILANGADLDEMTFYVAFNQRIHVLLKYLFRDFILHRVQLGTLK